MIVAAYVVMLREGPVRDAAEMAEYQRMNREKKSNPVAVEPIVIYGAVQGLEGQAPDGVIILKFATVEEAQAWYNTPEYQAAIPHRKRAADYRGFIVQGV